LTSGKNVITWYNATSKRIIFAGSVNVMQDDRLSIVNEGRALIIAGVAASDSGVYKCQVEARLNPISLEHQLRVLGQLSQPVVNRDNFVYTLSLLRNEYLIYREILYVC
jgi:hypothetical protein